MIRTGCLVLLTKTQTSIKTILCNIPFNTFSLKVKNNFFITDFKLRTALIQGMTKNDIELALTLLS